MIDKLDLIKARVASLEILNHRLSPRGGVTSGGFHQQEDGTAWYVKHHEIPDHAHAEHLANKIYRALGHNAPHSQVLYHHSEGVHKPVYFSKKIKDFNTLSYEGGFPNRESAHHFLHGLAADHLIGNHDLHTSNVGLVHGKAPVRIDNGSALRYSGGGTKRGDESAFHSGSPSDILGEGESHTHALIDAKVSESHVLSARYMAPHVKKILQLRQKHGGWQGFVDKHIPGAHSDVRADFANILEHRTRHLVDHVVNDFHGNPAQ